MQIKRLEKYITESTLDISKIDTKITIFPEALQVKVKIDMLIHADFIETFTIKFEFPLNIDSHTKPQLFSCSENTPQIGLPKDVGVSLDSLNMISQIIKEYLEEHTNEFYTKEFFEGIKRIEAKFPQTTEKFEYEAYPYSEFYTKYWELHPRLGTSYLSKEDVDFIKKYHQFFGTSDFYMLFAKTLLLDIFNHANTANPKFSYETYTKPEYIERIQIDADGGIHIYGTEEKYRYIYSDLAYQLVESML